MKRATIQDVADAAGVSRAAVSKVLRNAYGLSADMKAKVEAAMLQLNYRPQTAARGLRGKTYTLGIVLPEFRNPFSQIFWMEFMKSWKELNISQF